VTAESPSAVQGINRGAEWDLITEAFTTPTGLGRAR